MTVLITGATGFVGKHLAEALVKLERASFKSSTETQIRCLARPTSNISFLTRLGAQVVLGDLRDNNVFNNHLLEGIETVYHLAAVSGVKENVPEKVYTKVNTEATFRLAKACLKRAIKKFVYFSSMEAVGLSSATSSVLPIDENTPCTPTNPYGKSKLDAEKELLKLYEDHGFPVVILRPTVVYGPKDSLQHAPLKLIRSVEKRVYWQIGTGKNLVSWCYIKNLIKGALLAAKASNSEGQVYFISDERPYTICEITQAIANALSTKLRPFHIPLSLVRIMCPLLELSGKVLGVEPPLTRNKLKYLAGNYVCDISKAKSELNYNQLVGLEEGIRRTVDWYKRFLCRKPSISRRKM